MAPTKLTLLPAVHHGWVLPAHQDLRFVASSGLSSTVTVKGRSRRVSFPTGLNPLSRLQGSLRPHHGRRSKWAHPAHAGRDRFSIGRAVAGMVVAEELSTNVFRGNDFPATPSMRSWRSALLPLTRVSWSWHRTIVPLLLRHVHLGADDDPGQDSFVNRSFNFVLYVGPRYRDTIRSLSLCLSFDDKSVAHADNNCAGILALLDQITSLALQYFWELDVLPNTQAQLASLKQPIRHLQIEDITKSTFVAGCIRSCSQTLESLRLDFDTYPEVDFLQSEWTGILRTPHLHSLAIFGACNIVTGKAMSRIDLTVPGLRDLALSYVEPCQHGLAWANATTLESLTLVHTDVGLAFGQGTSGPAPTFPRLRRLVVLSGREDIYRVLGAISKLGKLGLPRLETVELSGYEPFYLRLLPVVANLQTLKALVCGYYDAAPADEDQSALRFALSQIRPQAVVTFEQRPDP